jgi:hypothetical protein
MALPARASVLEATAVLFAAGADLLTASVERIAQRDPGIPQRSPGSYQGWPSKTEVRALRAIGSPLMRIADLLQLRRLGPPVPPVR